MKTKEEIVKKIEEARKEMNESARDMLIFGTSIAEFCTDGTVRRIDPNSEEGQEIIKNKNKEIYETGTY